MEYRFQPKKAKAVKTPEKREKLIDFLLTQECNNNIQAACKALGFQKKFSTHDCRRYAATQAALCGMSTPAMQKAFGWKDRDTVEKYVQLAAATKEHEEMLVNVLN